MCFIPMNVHNELFNCVRQLRWQHLSPVVSTFSTSIWSGCYPSFSYSTASPFSPSFCPYVSISLSVVPHPVFLISGLSCGLEMLMFSSCKPKFFAVDYFNTGAVVPSSDHCRTEIVLPPSDHNCIESWDSSAIWWSLLHRSCSAI